jgi:hypothetical protein
MISFQAEKQEKEKKNRKLQKGERLPGRRGFRADELSAEAKDKLLELFNKQVPYKVICQVIREVYGEDISPAAACRYNRHMKEQFDMAADQTRKIREWSKAIVGAASENPDVDTGKILTSLMEGDLLAFITSVDMQTALETLPPNKIADMIYKMSRVSIARERLLWDVKVKKILSTAVQKAQKIEKEQNKEMTKEEFVDFLTKDIVGV